MNRSGAYSARHASQINSSASQGLISYQRKQVGENKGNNSTQEMLIDRRINMKLKSGANGAKSKSKCLAALGDEQKEEMEHYLNHKLGITCEHSR